MNPYKTKFDNWTFPCPGYVFHLPVVPLELQDVVPLELQEVHITSYNRCPANPAVNFHIYQEDATLGPTNSTSINNIFLTIEDARRELRALHLQEALNLEEELDDIVDLLIKKRDKLRLYRGLLLRDPYPDS